MSTDLKPRKLVLNRDSVRRLDVQEQQSLAGGAAPGGDPLTLTVSCYTAECLTNHVECYTSECVTTHPKCCGW